MDNIKTDRRKKSDKAKEKHERCPFSTKHVRLAEAAAEKRASQGKPAGKK